MHRRTFICCLISVFWTFSLSPISPVVGESLAAETPLRALYILTPPPDYKTFEDVVMNYKDSGADTIIIKPPVSAAGVDKSVLSKAVFFAHKAGFKLFVILPTRSSGFMLDTHPEWEDMRYDPRSGLLEPTGKLDVFNPYVTVYLSDLLRDVAGYAVDGILLDSDYYYGDLEGVSDTARQRFKEKYGTALSFRNAFAKITEEPAEDRKLDDYGEDFWKLADMKKTALQVLMNNIIQSVRAVNKRIKFGLAIPAPGLFVTEKEILAWYSHDVNAIRKSDIHHFWFTIPHRTLRAEQDMNYKKTMETVSRLAHSSTSLWSDPAKMVIAVQAVDIAGKPLPFSEIEEVAALVKRTDTGIALMVEAGSLLPAEFTRKIFKGQAL